MMTHLCLSSRAGGAASALLNNSHSGNVGAPSIVFLGWLLLAILVVAIVGLVMAAWAGSVKND